MTLVASVLPSSSVTRSVIASKSASRGSEGLLLFCSAAALGWLLSSGAGRKTGTGT